MQLPKINKKWIIGVILIAPYIVIFLLVYNKESNVPPLSAVSFIVINKADMTLKAYDNKGKVMMKSFVATGKAAGDKKKVGDLKTPEGVFPIVEIEDASTWTHDFKDDKQGPVKGAYGPFFIRLDVPGHKGIGIHGTHDPSSIGKRASEGCIRLKNEEVRLLTSLIQPGIPVVIIPGKDDLIAH